MIRIFPKSRLLKALAIVAALFALYTLLGFFAAPPLIQRAITKYAAERLERKASVGEVRVNPLRLQLEINEVSLAGRDGKPIAGFSRLFADFEVSSLWRRAWTFSEVALAGLDVRADIGPDGKLNLAALLDRLPKTERRPDDRLPRLLLDRIVLSGAKVSFTDRSGPTSASAALDPINLELRDLSTLPDHRGEYTLKARLVDGGAFNWRGTAALEPLSSQGEVRIIGLKPLTAWRFLRDELNVAEPRGEFDIVSRYRFAFTGGAPTLTLEEARVSGRGIAIAAAGASGPLMTLASVEVKGARFDLVSREFLVPVMEARDGSVTAERDSRGDINWSRLVKAASVGNAAAPAPRPAESAAPGKPWKGRIESLRVAGVRLAYTDRSRGRPIQAGAKAVTVNLAAALEVGAGGVRTLTLEEARVSGRGIAIAAAGASGPLMALASVEVKGARFDLVSREFLVPVMEARDGTVTAERDSRGDINWSQLVKAASVGNAAAPAPGKPWKGRIESLRVAGVRLAYTDRSRRRPIQAGAKAVTVSLAAALEAGAGRSRATLDKVALAIAQPSFQYTDNNEKPVAFDAISLEGGRVDFAEKQVALGRIVVKGGAVKATRDRNGSVPAFDGLLGKATGRPGRQTGAAPKEGRSWRIALESLEIGGTSVALSDRSFVKPISYDGQNLRARVTGYRSDGKDPAKLEASLRFRQGGSVKADGTFQASGDAFNARIRLDRFNLKPLHPVVAGRMRAELMSGEVSADVKARYRARGGRHEVRAAGPVRIDNLLLNEAESGERLLAWQSLAASGLQFSLYPDALKIDEARVTGLGAKIVIFKDRSVNLAQVMIPRPAPAGEAVAAADGDPEFPVTVDRVDVEGGTVNFADLSLVLPFSADVTALEGTVQGIGTERASRATVRLEGRVGEHGIARVNGSLRPFRPASFLDLNVVFRNIDVPPLSPYTATFAGRQVASGRLALDLHYKIDEGKLAGDNRVMLENFTLGERVEAPGALDLPLDLAVALLTDSRGRIDISVPVRGDLGDPQFSYGDVIWQAIASLITRIVTAPFRALGALFGGGGESLDDIAFDPGGASLLPSERDTLKRLAEGLAKRPQLRLVIEGQHGPADRTALQQRDVEAAVAARLGRPPAAGAPADPVNVTDAKTQRALEAMFAERHSDEALRTFVSETGNARGKPVERVNAALALIGRASADREFYDALLKRLVDSAPVPEDALKRLAADRARTVADHLTTALEVPAARLEMLTASGAAQAKLRLEAAPAPASAATESP